MKNKNFSFSFTENIGKFMILRRDIGKIRSFCKFCGVSLNVQEQRQSSKLWKPRSFDVHKNTTAPTIAMLGRPGSDMEVSDAGMETVKSDNCRGMSGKNGDANGVLATI